MLTGGEIIIGGDDQYKDEDEEERTVISRWARRKVASQFSEEYLDEGKSFIFSGNEKHGKMHEETLLHYFDPSKKGLKFEDHPKPAKRVPNLPSHRGFVVNCDHTYDLNVVEKLLLEMNEKHGLNISNEKLNFRQDQMREISETTIPYLQMDFAIFVVHSEESRLSINEGNAGICNKQIYRALLRATGKWNRSIQSWFIVQAKTA